MANDTQYGLAAYAYTNVRPGRRGAAGATECTPPAPRPWPARLLNHPRSSPPTQTTHPQQDLSRAWRVAERLQYGMVGLNEVAITAEV